MSRPARCAFVSVLLAVAIGTVVVACATGASSGGDDMQEPQDAAVSTKMDSSVTTFVDAPPTKLDSGVVVVDAFVPLDAPPDSLFCTDNAQCTTAGQCCLTLGGPMGFCAPGTVVLGACIPIN